MEADFLSHSLMDYQKPALAVPYNRQLNVDEFSAKNTYNILFSSKILYNYWFYGVQHLNIFNNKNSSEYNHSHFYQYLCYSR